MPHLQNRRHLQRIQDRDDPEAWRELLTLFARTILGWGRRRCMPDTEAHKLAQKALGQFVDTLPTCRCQPGDMGVWSLRVVYRVYCELGKDYGPLAANVSGSPSVEERHVWNEEFEFNLLAGALESVRDRTDDTSWRAFWLTEIEGTSPQMVAETLKLTAGDVLVVRCRLFAELRNVVNSLN